MNENEKYDYMVIGSGPGGYVSAIRSAQLGLKTAVIERAEVGGICLNWGCIPTKSLLESAHLLEAINKGGLGISTGDSVISADMNSIVDRSRQVASRLSKGIEGLLKKYKVELLRGFASFEDSHQLNLASSESTSRLYADKICIATGARARQFSHLQFSEKVLSYKEAMLEKTNHKKWLIIGAGAIGCEFADYFRIQGRALRLLNWQNS